MERSKEKADSRLLTGNKANEKTVEQYLQNTERKKKL